MNYDELELLVDQLSYKPGTRILLGYRQITNQYYLQVECERIDITTGRMGVGRGGTYVVEPGATLSEVVQAVFGLVRNYEEHEAREWFKYRGRRVFGPHMDVEALWTVAKQTDARPGPTSVRDAL